MNLCSRGHDEIEKEFCMFKFVVVENWLRKKPDLEPVYIYDGISRSRDYSDCRD